MKATCGSQIFLYYSFQNNCIEIIQKAKPIQTNDLSVKGSFKNIQVKSANKNIPMLKPINRLGHTKPLNAPAICFVAMIDPYDTTIPTEDIIIGLSAAHLLKNWR